MFEEVCERRGPQVVVDLCDDTVCSGSRRLLSSAAVRPCDRPPSFGPHGAGSRADVRANDDPGGTVDLVATDHDRSERRWGLYAGISDEGLTLCGWTTAADTMIYTGELPTAQRIFLADTDQ